MKKDMRERERERERERKRERKRERERERLFIPLYMFKHVIKNNFVLFI